MHLHPNWLVLHRNHMDQLKQMIADNHPQSWEARRLLTEAYTEYRRLISITNESDDTYVI